MIVNSPSLDDLFKINGVQILCLFFEYSFFFISSLLGNGDAIIENKIHNTTRIQVIRLVSQYVQVLTILLYQNISKKISSLPDIFNDMQSKTRPLSKEFIFECEFPIR